MLHAEPVRTFSLPQGYPWSPAALQVTLALPTRRLRWTQAASFRQAAYLDDRTIGADEVDSFEVGHNHWSEFEFASGTRGNAAKRQVWARTPGDEAVLARAGWAASAERGHVLGM
eukprot:6332847-Alexandrium_andersonii.AAC.1